MPFLIPDKDDPRFNKLLDYFDQLSTLYQEQNTILHGGHEDDIQKLRDNIDELVFDLHDLYPLERQLVRDMVEYEIGFFHWSKRKQRTLNDAKSGPVRRPSTQMLVEYAETFTEAATSVLSDQDQTLNAIVYQDSAPLNVIAFELVDMPDAKNVLWSEESKTLRDLLYKLDRLLLEQHTSTLYSRRFVRIFDGPRFYLVRPSERRFWIRSQALADADSFIAEILVYSKEAAMEAFH
jgi:hypothetical protein